MLTQKEKAEAFDDLFSLVAVQAPKVLKDFENLMARRAADKAALQVHRTFGRLFRPREVKASFRDAVISNVGEE